MLEIQGSLKSNCKKAAPKCPIFGQCGGCFFQDIEYKDELALKDELLRSLLLKNLDIKDSVFLPVVASPNDYHYRHRLDLKLKKTLDKKIFIGFTPIEHRGVIPVEECSIAMKALSDFIPELKKQAIEKLPEKYKLASLVVKASQDGRVFWGGIGKGSLKQNQEDYLYTTINTKKVHFSLETFFQANFSILPHLMDVIKGLDIWESNTQFYDLYGGVGLFSITLNDVVKDIFLIEENPASIRLAEYNKEYHQMSNLNIIEGTVEEHLPKLLSMDKDKNHVAMIDPPRAGLSVSVRDMLKETKDIKHLLYLSCNPQALVADLKNFMDSGWCLQKVIPFDFFPRTRHLETLVLLSSEK